MSDDEACLLKSPNRLLKRRSPAGFGYEPVLLCDHRLPASLVSPEPAREHERICGTHLRHINATSLVRRKHAHGVLPQVLRQLSTKND